MVVHPIMEAVPSPEMHQLPDILRVTLTMGVNQDLTNEVS